ncbi:hypothetical protein BDZ89DRAFT_1220755 [Hymenopellis radicata]|nr:hypothetical protein BDZ89DRAFT_1220755 [Hymenopellis radicata]
MKVEEAQKKFWANEHDAVVVLWWEEVRAEIGEDRSLSGKCRDVRPARRSEKFLHNIVSERLLGKYLLQVLASPNSYLSPAAPPVGNKYLPPGAGCGTTRVIEILAGTRNIARALNICLPEVNTYYAETDNIVCPVDLVQLVAERATATDDSLNIDPRVEYNDATPTYVPPASVGPVNATASATASCSIWVDVNDRERAAVELAFRSTDAATRILESIKLPSNIFFPRTDYSQGDPEFTEPLTPLKRAGKKKHHTASRSRNARKNIDSKGYQELRPSFDSLKVESLNISSTKWSGRALPYLVGDAIIAAWQSFSLGPALSMFHRLPFSDSNQLPAKIFDVKGRLVIYRSNLVRLFAPSPSAGVSAGLNALASVEFASPLMRDFVMAADRFVAATTKYVGDNVRGSHWFMISGHDRQNKEMPALTAWHRQNIKPLQELFTRGRVFDRTSAYTQICVSGLANGMLVHFPGIKARYEQMANYMALVYGISPLYGLFWNFCLNHGGHRRLVDCRPHVDKANIAIGVCVIFIYGMVSLPAHCRVNDPIRMV